MRAFGTRISGIESIDRNLDKQEFETEMTIDSMFEKYRNGVTVRLLNYSDSAIIYKIIHSHLIAWAEYLSRGINVDAPLKDLIELDEYAAVVYDKARSVFSPDVKMSALASNFSNVQTINFHNVLKRAVAIPETSVQANGVEVNRITRDPAKIKDGLPIRNSFKDIFADEISRSSAWRSE